MARQSGWTKKNTNTSHYVKYDAGKILQLKQLNDSMWQNAIQLANARCTIVPVTRLPIRLHQMIDGINSTNSILKILIQLKHLK